jgi:hypothetical protein
MKCPRCRKALTDAELKTMWATYCAQQRKQPAGGHNGGRPRSDAPRCPCGAMTATRAAARNHTCEAPQAHA